MGASPKGRAFSCSSLRVAHHRRRSSRASSKAWSTARCTGGTFVRVPRSHGSGSFIRPSYRRGASGREERRGFARLESTERISCKQVLRLHGRSPSVLTEFREFDTQFVGGAEQRVLNGVLGRIQHRRDRLQLESLIVL